MTPEPERVALKRVNGALRVVTVIPREHTPAETLRRIVISMMRTLAKEWPEEYRAVGRELGVVK